MKKLSILMVVALILSFSVTAFAEQEDPEPWGRPKSIISTIK